MSALRLHTTLFLSFLAAQALSLPHLDPRYPPGHDIRTPAAQSTALTTTAMLTSPYNLPTSISPDVGFGKRLENENPTIGPELEGLSRKFKARRGVDNDSHHTLAPIVEAETANHSRESDYGENNDTKSKTLSRPTKRSVLSSTSLVTSGVTENQKKPKAITKRATHGKCNGPEDYVCLGYGQGAVSANGMVQVDHGGDTLYLEPINKPSENDHPKGWTETPPATGHR